MHYQTTRKLARASHIAIAVVQLVYIYTPVHDLPNAMLFVQIVTTPILIMSGIWITKGQKIWQFKEYLKESLHISKLYRRFGRKKVRIF